MKNLAAYAWNFEELWKGSYSLGLATKTVSALIISSPTRYIQKHVLFKRTISEYLYKFLANHLDSWINQKYLDKKLMYKYLI